MAKEIMKIRNYIKYYIYSLSTDHLHASLIQGTENQTRKDLSSRSSRLNGLYELTAQNTTGANLAGSTKTMGKGTQCTLSRDKDGA